MLSVADLDRAAAVIGSFFAPTPQYHWPLLSAAIGAETWVKHEDATPLGAFKVRGGLVFAERLRRERPHIRRIVSATRGNHGQSLAFAARAFGLQATIVVPEGNSEDKNAAMVALGAELIVHGADFQEAREHAATLAGSDDAEMVPPFHIDLVTGVATYARELLTAVAGLDTVYVPVGMGSGVCGVILVRDLLGLSTEVVGVCAANAPATALSFAAGAPMDTPTAATFIDGVATRSSDPAAIDIICRGAARIVTVSEDEAAEAVRLHYRGTHHLPEPAGAIALAAAVAERDRIAGRRIAVIQSGANMDRSMAATLLAGGTPRP